MSKTDKTAPDWVQEARGEHARHNFGYPCACFPAGAYHAGLRRKHERKARTKLRAELAAGREPQPVQHRHRAGWDAW